MVDEALVRAKPTPAQLRADIWVGVAVLIGGVISAALSGVAGLFGAGIDKLPFAMGIVAIYGIAISVRRRYPISVAVIVCVAYFTSISFKLPEIYAGNVAVFIAIYTVGAWVRNRRVANLSRVLLVAAMFVWLISSMFVQSTTEKPKLSEAIPTAGLMSPFVAFWIIQLLINIAYFGAAYYLGDRSYASAIDKLRAARQQAELDHQREITAAQAVALDRVHIARELHDVVAHHVSAMGVQAGAARAVMDVDPAAAREALADVEGSARAAIDELHQLLQTLRSKDDEALAHESASTLKLSAISELVQRAEDVGVPTSFEVIGVPRDVPDTVQVNLFRIAQESLTNARRHGGPNVRADVRLRYLESGVELEVTNMGRTPSTVLPGLGQLGMRERAAASGGTIEIGARDRGGFRVRAHIPLATSPKKAEDE